MSSSRQGLLPKLTIPAGLFRRGINLWPPFVGAGIRVTRVSADSREIDVTLKLGLLNRNFFGTQFGGSLFAMTDPFFALMMLRNLGPEYVVWDKAGSIAYRRPGRGDVFAHFRLPASAIARARRATAHGATARADVPRADRRRATARRSPRSRRRCTSGAGRPRRRCPSARRARRRRAAPRPRD